MFAFQRDGSQVPNKDSPSLKRLTKCLCSLQKDLYAFQRKEKVLINTILLHNFAKISVLRKKEKEKSLPLF